MSKSISALTVIPLLSSLTSVLTVAYGSTPGQGMTMSSNETAYVLGKRVQETVVD